MRASNLEASNVEEWPRKVAETRRGRRKGEKRLRAGELETLFGGVKTRYVVENTGRASGRDKQRPDMCMKTKGRTAQSRYVIENKSG